MTAVATPTILRDVMLKGTDFLARHGVEEPRLNMEHLLAHALDMSRLELYLNIERPLTDAEVTTARGLVQRRGLREPLQHILGNQPFRNVTVQVTGHTLVPRPETEELTGLALEWLTGRGGEGLRAPAVLDLGTGSGCMAIAVADECPTAQVTAVDCSADALTIARANGESCRVSDRVDFMEGDLYDALPPGGRFDLILSNPPYLTPDEWQQAAPEVRDHEPQLALVGGEDGLEFYRRILSGAAVWLNPDGIVLLEIGLTQGQAVAAIATDAGFMQVEILDDLSGRPRMVRAGQLEVG